jgi:hypothetical protein
VIWAYQDRDDDTLVQRGTVIEHYVDRMHSATTCAYKLQPLGITTPDKLWLNISVDQAQQQSCDVDSVGDGVVFSWWPVVYSHR